MLAVLRISNLAIVDELEIEFSPGLNVLTGETGAGKSVVLKALEVLTGKRVGADVIRSSAEKCEVEGLFLLTSQMQELLKESIDEIDEILTEEELLIKRIIDRTGRSKFYLNGHLTTAAVLLRISPLLVDITGQHQQQTLLDSSKHRELLDCFGIAKNSLDQVKEYYLAFTKAEQNVNRFIQESGLRAEYFRRISFERDELRDIALVEGERDELNRELNRLASVEQLQLVAAQCLELIEDSDGCLLTRLLTLQSTLQNAVQLDATLSPVSALVETAVANISETGLELRHYHSKLEANPDHLETLRERIAEISRIERKYRQTVPELIAHLQKIEQELSEWESGLLTEDELRKKLELAKRQLEESEHRLHQERLTLAERLSRMVQQELITLSMKHARFRVEVRKGNSSPHGADTVEFLLAANPGEAFHALSRVASGGELSRLLLILKTLLHERMQPALQVFDEVDTGVGGAVAQVVGEKLKRIAQKNQVLLVTHAPQIAAFADRHLSIAKITSKNSTKSVIQTLGFEERVHEIAKMLAGKNVSTNFEDSARELLQELSGVQRN